MSVDQFLLSADTTDLNYPEIRPTLDLNFARTKTLDPRITFTRASGGSYVGADGLIKYAGVNEPRFDHDPATGESLGLLVEEARTNIKIRSEELNLDFGYAAIASILQNEVISPDGLKTADGIVANNTFSAHYMDKVFTSASGITASQNICASAFFKKGVGRDIYIWMYAESGNAAHWVSFNFLTESVNTGVTAEYTSGGGVTTGYGVIKYPNGWYRLWISGYPNTTTTGRRLRVWLSNETGNISSFSGDNISPYVYAWGFQVEVGGFPTSYIPTQASTRTRQPDNASITGKNFSEWYNQSEWSLMVAARRNYGGNFLGFPNLLRINDGTSNNTIGFYGASASVQFTNFGVISGGIPQTSYVAINIPTTSQFKMFQALKFNDSTFGVNETLTSTDTSVLMPVGVNQMIIGGDGKWGGTISRIMYYPKHLSNSQLISLTR